MRISIDKAIQLIKERDVVAAPTETVYGLAASIEHPEAIQKIFTLKNRPTNNPLITHLANIDQVKAFVDHLPKDFHRLAEAFWPGALTLVIPVLEDAVPDIIRANLRSAAFRVPSHPLVQKLITGVGPIVMPSANLSGKPSSTIAEHVEHDFGEDFPILDGGSCETGIESTVLIADGEVWKVGRLGGISPKQIEKVLGYWPEMPSTQVIENPLCPGQMYRHYAPNARLHFDTYIPEYCPVVIGFSERDYPPNKTLKVLGSIKDPQSVARRLYHTFRKLDEEGVTDAWIDMDFPVNDLWASIRERIVKAASK
ncbi:MAG: L-threonylcarbamoyladenylate synthase [Chlamydiota bacterium]